MGEDRYWDEIGFFFRNRRIRIRRMNNKKKGEANSIKIEIKKR